MTYKKNYLGLFSYAFCLGDEMGMIEDMYTGLQDLRQVNFKVKTSLFWFCLKEVNFRRN